MSYCGHTCCERENPHAHSSIPSQCRWCILRDARKTPRKDEEVPARVQALMDEFAARAPRVR